jgi:hypothetical protein
MKLRTILLVCGSSLLLLVSGCSRKNPLAGRTWEFVYSDNDYTTLTFSDDSFSVVDTKHGRREGVMITNGSYLIEGNNLILKGDSAQLTVDNVNYSNTASVTGYDGTYVWKIHNNILRLEKNKDIFVEFTLVR